MGMKDLELKIDSIFYIILIYYYIFHFFIILFDLFIEHFVPKHYWYLWYII